MRYIALRRVHEGLGPVDPGDMESQKRPVWRAKVFRLPAVRQMTNLRRKVRINAPER